MKPNSSCRHESYSTRRSHVLLIAALILLPVSAQWGNAQEPKESTQYGAKRLDFSVGEHKGFVILPTKAAADGSKPWVWYAPAFIGQLPDDSHTWMANQLIAAGFAIAGVDVGESYGSPAGTKAYTEFYDHVVKTYGLDAKACLLPQSRGGLMLLNWAIENPGHVQCIAGIYAVSNLASYPGVEKCCSAYGLDAKTMDLTLSQYNPIDRLKPLADAKIPQVYIHGDSDKVVPVEANSGELVKRCLAMGGRAGLILVPGKGHEVCPEFFHSQKFVDFLLSKGDLGSTERPPAAGPKAP